MDASSSAFQWEYQQPTERSPEQTIRALGFVPPGRRRSISGHGAALLQPAERDPPAPKTSIPAPIRRTPWPLPRPELAAGRAHPSSPTPPRSLPLSSRPRPCFHLLPAPAPASSVAAFPVPELLRRRSGQQQQCRAQDGDSESCVGRYCINLPAPSSSSLTTDPHFPSIPTLHFPMANACTNLTGVVRSVRQFKIDGFSLVSATMTNDECIKSRWDFDGYEWEIHCYPKCLLSGVWAVGLKLILITGNGTSNVRARLGCLLVHPRKLNNASHSEVSVTHMFKRPKDCSSKVFLVDTRDLPAPSSLNDDYLTVQCTITIVKELPEAAKAVPVPSSNLHRHLGELLRSGTGSDVTFVVSGETFAAHKNILAARSPVLMAEFFGHMREASSPRVVIEDMEAAAFKAMLHFIYTDTVPELDRELEAVATMAQHLLAAADRYGLDRLKVICEGKLFGGISVDTAAMTLALAEQHNCSHLKAKCVEFIVSTPAILDAVVATEGYKHLEASCPAALTSIVISMRGRSN